VNKSIKVSYKDEDHKVSVRKVRGLDMEFIVPGWNDFITGDNKPYVKQPIPTRPLFGGGSYSGHNEENHSMEEA
jgi:hypothetical protein